MASEPPRGPDDREDRDDHDEWQTTEPIPELPARAPSDSHWSAAGPDEPPLADSPTSPPSGADSTADEFVYDDTGLPMGPRRVLPLEPEPSPLISRYLFPTERFRGEWRRHWVHLFRHAAIGVLATFVMGYLSGVFARNNAETAMSVVVIVWLLVLAWVGWQFVDWWFDRFILTNKRVMVIAGVVTRHVAMMPLLRVTDMKYEQSPLGRMLNYGTFVMESAGQDQALREIKHLPNPNELYLRVCEEMYEPEAVEARLGEESEDEPAERERVGDA